MSKTPPHMWRYWVVDKGIETAMEEYFPDLFQNDPVLLTARAHYYAAIQIMDDRMKQLAGEQEDDSTDT